MCLLYSWDDYIIDVCVPVMLLIETLSFFVILTTIYTTLKSLRSLVAGRAVYLFQNSAVAFQIAEATMTLHSHLLLLVRFHASTGISALLTIQQINVLGKSSGSLLRLFQKAVRNQLGTEPVLGNGKHFGRVVISLEFLVNVQVLHFTLPSAFPTISQVEKVGRPFVETIKDLQG
jgi:hypothetical protein